MTAPIRPDLQPDPNPPMRNVKQIDKNFIGRAPGMEPILAAIDSADGARRHQLTVLGD